MVQSYNREKDMIPTEIWNFDKEYLNIFKTVQFTLVDHARCYVLFKMAKHFSNVSGEAAEVGVYKGGTARILTSVFSKSGKEIYLFDTFEGMPEVDIKKDKHAKGDFADCSLEMVEEQLKDLSHYKIYKGTFPKNTEDIKEKIFCFVHIDVDIYKSVKDCCEFFYNKMIAGGIMIFDDYGWPSCPGAKEAIDEFFSNKKEEVIYIPSGQAFVMKLS